MNNNPKFYLAVVDISNLIKKKYAIYIVNTTDKEYFLRETYKEHILKTKSAVSLGEIKKDRDAPAINLYITDDKEETYSLYFSNLPAYCQEFEYDEYLDRDDVCKLTCKLENIGKYVVQIQNKSKNEAIDKLKDLLDKNLKSKKLNIAKVYTHLKEYLKLYNDYNLSYRFFNLLYFLDDIKTILVMNNFTEAVKDFDKNIKEIILSSKILEHKDFLINYNKKYKEDLDSFLEYLQSYKMDKESKDMEITLSEDYETNEILLQHFKELDFEVKKSEEGIRISRWYFSYDYKAIKKYEVISFNSIATPMDYDETFYISISQELFQKYFYDFLFSKSVKEFTISYKSKDKKSKYQENVEFNKRNGY